MDKQELIERVEGTFPLGPLPEQLAGKQTPYEDEYAYVEDFFKGRPWNAFSMRELREQYRGDPSAIPAFMSDEALAYYLPAFLLIVVTDYDAADQLVDSVVETITPADGDRLDRLRPRFTPRQANAIAGFLSFLSEEHPGDVEQSRLDEAIRYWS